MVFDKMYDKSLWLLIKGDIDSKKKISDFVYNIPLELRKQIQEKLNIVNDNRKKNLYLIQENYFHGSYKKDGKLYYYSINPYNYGLSLGCSRENERGYERILEITLFPLDNTDLYDEKNNLLVGRIEYNGDLLAFESSKTLFLSSGILGDNSFKFLFQISPRNEVMNIKILNSKKLDCDIMFDRDRKLVRRKIK